MPVLDGFEATRQIDEYCNARDKQVPIVALSADVMPETMNKIKDSTMAGFIIKPINPKVLKNKLLEVITATSNVRNFLDSRNY